LLKIFINAGKVEKNVNNRENFRNFCEIYENFKKRLLRYYFFSEKKPFLTIVGYH